MTRQIEAERLTRHVFLRRASETTIVVAAGGLLAPRVSLAAETDDIERPRRAQHHLDAVVTLDTVGG